MTTFKSCKHSEGKSRPTINPQPGPSSTRPIEGTYRTPVARGKSYLSRPEDGDSSPDYRASALPFGPDRSAMLRCPARILMRKIVVGKAAKHRSRDPDAVICRMKTDRAMSGRSELVPERRLDQAVRKKLPDALVALNGLGDGFARKPVHQIRMNQNAGAPERRAHTGGVEDRNAYLHFFKKPIRGRFQTGADGDAARCREQTAEIRRKRRFEANVSPPGDCHSAFQQGQSEALQAGL